MLFFLFLLQNIDCGYTTVTTASRGGSNEAVLTSTHNLCFGAKIRKIGIPLYTPVLLLKSGVGGGGYTFHGHVFLMRQNGGSNIVI